MLHVDIFTDGSSRGNPGPGGYGSILRFVDRNGRTHEKELSQGFRLTTNNRMELLGVIVALEALKSPCEVTLYSDSQYVVNAFNQHWVDGWVKRGWKNLPLAERPRRPPRKRALRRPGDRRRRRRRRRASRRRGVCRLGFGAGAPSAGCCAWRRRG